MSAQTVKKMKRAAQNVSSEPSNNVRKNPKINLKDISPKTANQKLAFDLYRRNFNLILKGSAGTGKTFISIYLALKSIFQTLDEETPTKLIIVRSAVPTRDVGALPGDLSEKTGIYELPYFAICGELTNNKNAYQTLKADNVISFVPTSYVRGITFSNAIIIVDEASNLNYHELASIITRAGENCRFIFCGDYKQSDFAKEFEKKGFRDFCRVAEDMPSFRTVDFTSDDIVRSELVKSFIIAEELNGIV
jgi:phosphate starvation-inducible protein PhoH